AAQRVPPGPQFQPTVAKTAWPPDNAVELLNGEIFIANPSSDHCQISHHQDLHRYIFFRTNKLDSTPAFTQRFLLPPEIGVDQPKQAQVHAISRLRLDDFLLLCACGDKSRLCLPSLFCQARDEAFYK